MPKRPDAVAGHTARSFALLLACLLMPAVASALDCARAGTRVEKMICAAPALQTLDSQLEARYRQALEVAQDSATVRTLQRHWLGERNACADADCIEQRYQERLARLQDYVDALAEEDSSFIAAAIARSQCLKVVPPEAPNLSPACRVLQLEPLGEIGGWPRLFALYRLDYRWNDQQRIVHVPVLLAQNPDDTGRLMLDFLMLNVPALSGETLPGNLTPRRFEDARGEGLEFRFSGLDGQPDVRRYRLKGGLWSPEKR